MSATETEELRGELAALVSALRTHLGWLRDQGGRGVPSGPSPRFGVMAAPSVSAAHPGPDPGVASVAQRPTVEEGAAVDVRASARAGKSGESEGEGAPGEPPAVGLARLREELGACRGCRLSQTRTNLVFGTGHAEATLMFIGEAPGRDEDEQGEPFVGAAGQLLTKMIEAMGLRREEVYIANIIKCRPPQNRDPAPDEVEACERYLSRQIEIIGPRLIIAMGNFAAKTLLRTEQGITRLRGRFHTYQGVPLMPTFHPAYLLRNPDGKRPVWEDLKAVMAEMDRLGLKRRR